VPRALAVVLTLLASAAIAVAFAACGDDDGDEVSGVEAVDANCEEVECFAQQSTIDQAGPDSAGRGPRGHDRGALPDPVRGRNHRQLRDHPER
jgi:hypothetical protein